MNFKEIETKYAAQGISFARFEEHCQGSSPIGYVFASGHDYFYAKADDPNSFCRHRVGPDKNELTFKRKTKSTDNIVRTEHNIELTKVITRPQVEALCSEFGYIYNTSIFKTCFIYKYENHVLSYYICFDTDMQEVGRFVEIELREDKVWATDKEALNYLKLVESGLKSIGVNPKARIKKSLFEIFKK